MSCASAFRNLRTVAAAKFVRQLCLLSGHQKIVHRMLWPRQWVTDNLSLCMSNRIEFGAGEFQGYKGAISHDTVRALAKLH